MASMNMTKPTVNSQRVVVGMSGGVDSAVTAALLQAQGYAVIGVTLKLWQVPGAPSEANSESQALAVAEALHIPCHVLDLRERFYERVVTPFVDAYADGLTPNPCVMCNPTFKFVLLLEQAEVYAAQWIATGHYARVVHVDSGAHLFRARCIAKDQSYALHRLTQRHLTRLLMPLGEIESKAAVREIARQRHLPSATQRDSQDLCFMQGGDYRTLLSELRPGIMQPGPIYNEAGEQLGTHQGLPRYTVGQRGGLRIAAPTRLYVLRLDTLNNALIVGPRRSLAREQCHITQFTFISGAPPASTFPAQGRIRYRAPLIPVTVTMPDDGCATVHFDTPQFGVAVGQALVLYQGDEVLGGGVISTPPESERV